MEILEPDDEDSLQKACNAILNDELFDTILAKCNVCGTCMTDLEFGHTSSAQIGWVQFPSAKTRILVDKFAEHPDYYARMDWKSINPALHNAMFTLILETFALEPKMAAFDRQLPEPCMTKRKETSSTDSEDTDFENTDFEDMYETAKSVFAAISNRASRTVKAGTGEATEVEEATETDRESPAGDTETEEATKATQSIHFLMETYLSEYASIRSELDESRNKINAIFRKNDKPSDTITKRHLLEISLVDKCGSLHCKKCFEGFSKTIKDCDEKWKRRITGSCTWTFEDKVFKEVTQKDPCQGFPHDVNFTFTSPTPEVELSGGGDK